MISEDWSSHSVSRCSIGLWAAAVYTGLANWREIFCHTSLKHILFHDKLYSPYETQCKLTGTFPSIIKLW